MFWIPLTPNFVASAYTLNPKYDSFRQVTINLAAASAEGLLSLQKSHCREKAKSHDLYCTVSIPISPSLRRTPETTCPATHPPASWSHVCSHQIYDLYIYKCDSTSNSQTDPNSPTRPGLPAIQSQNVVLTPDGCDDYQAVKTVKTVITWVPQ